MLFTGVTVKLAALHIVVVMFVIEGFGFAVIVNVWAVPVHVTPPFVYDGVTVIVAVMGAFVPLVTVKVAILPVPLAVNPIEGVLFVQL